MGRRKREKREREEERDNGRRREIVSARATKTVRSVKGNT